MSASKTGTNRLTRLRTIRATIKTNNGTSPTLTTLPQHSRHTNLTIKRILGLSNATTTTLLAPTTNGTLLNRIKRIMTVTRKHFKRYLRLLNMLIRRRPRVLTTLILTTRTKRRPRRLLNTLFKTKNRLLRRLATKVFLSIRKNVIRLMYRHRPYLRRKLTRRLRRPNRGNARVLNTSVILTFTTKNRIGSSLLIRNGMNRHFPQVNQSTNTRRNILPNKSFTTSPSNITVTIDEKSIPLRLLQQKNGTTQPTNQSARTTINTKIPVFSRIKTNRSLVTVKTSILTNYTKNTVKIRIPTLLTIRLKINNLRRHVRNMTHGSAREVAPFRNPSP